MIQKAIIINFMLCNDEMYDIIKKLMNIKILFLIIMEYIITYIFCY